MGVVRYTYAGGNRVVGQDADGVPLSRQQDTQGSLSRMVDTGGGISDTVSFSVFGQVAARTGTDSISMGWLSDQGGYAPAGPSGITFEGFLQGIAYDPSDGTPLLDHVPPPASNFRASEESLGQYVQSLLSGLWGLQVVTSTGLPLPPEPSDPFVPGPPVPPGPPKAPDPIPQSPSPPHHRPTPPPCDNSGPGGAVRWLKTFVESTKCLLEFINPFPINPFEDPSPMGTGPGLLHFCVEHSNKTPEIMEPVSKRIPLVELLKCFNEIRVKWEEEWDPEENPPDYCGCASSSTEQGCEDCCDRRLDGVSQQLYTKCINRCGDAGYDDD